MKACPFCAEEIQDAAIGCRHCGRRFAPRQQKRASTSKEIAFGVGVAFAIPAALFAVVIAWAWLTGSLTSHGESSPPPRAAAPMSRETKRAIFLADSADHDWSREYILKTMLKAGGQRCDKITKQVMVERGIWHVRCDPGYEFIFSFDENGELKSALASSE